MESMSVQLSVQPDRSSKLTEQQGIPSQKPFDQAQRAHDSTSDRQCGLLQLKDFSKIESGRNYKLDIVALHGLNGHAIKSWQSDNTIWFRDLLPNLVSEADLRISSFGYHSEILFGPTRDSMLDFELRLLAALSTLRKSTNTTGIPILFLCHSLGGILFKKTLRLAADRPKQYGDLATSVKGVMFFGTPHRGSGSANLPGIIFEVLKSTIPGGNFRADLIKNLKRGSEELSEIAMNTIEQLEDLKIISVFETKVLGLCGTIVNRESALLNIPDELPIPVDADHRDVCRFSKRNESEFRPVLNAAANLVKSVIVHTQPRFYEECLESLYFPEFQERRLRITEPYEDTFAWVWNHRKFAQWTGSNASALLWLQGKPASGKSTIMNFVRKGLQDHLRQRDELSSVSTKQYAIIDFFYSARGGANERQSGHVWMIRSILYQILRNVPDLWTSFCNILEPSLATTNGKVELPLLSINFKSKVWHLEDLQRLLMSIGLKYRGPDRILIYILVDAMDESEKDQRLKIVSSLFKIGNYPESSPITFKVMVASRPDSLTSAIGQRCIFMLLEEETFSDILKFVDLELNRIAADVPSLQHKSFGFLREGLIQKCQGVFLWVKLVLLELEQKANEDGCTIREMEELLLSIPTGLEQLYDRMNSLLSTQTQQQKRETKSILEWTAYGLRPITPLEMRDIAAATAWTGERLTVAEMTRNRVMTVDEMKRRIVTRCGNFLEVKAEKISNSGTTTEIVQFIHTTALEYLMSLPQAVEISLRSRKDAESSIISLLEKYVDFLASLMPDWNSLATTNSNFPIAALRIADIQPVVDFLTTYQPALLEL